MAKKSILDLTARPRRWSLPYADEMAEAEMSYDKARSLLRGPLRQLARERKRFPGDLSVADILRFDTRIREYAEGELIVHAGDYGNSAFFVLEGSVQVLLAPLPKPPRKRQLQSSVPKLFRAVCATLRRNSPIPETRGRITRQKAEQEANRIVHLQDFPEFLLEGDEREFDPSMIQTLSGASDQVGEIFGEIAALSRNPHTSNVVAGESGARLLEIRWQGLRDIRKFSPEWKEMVDDRYRSSSLLPHLRFAEYVSSLAHNGSSEALKELAEATSFRSYGEFSWKSTFKEMAESGTSEPHIVEQDSFAGELLLVRSGFIRVTRKYNHGEKTVAYLGKGQSYGMCEILENHRGGGEPIPYQHTLRAVGRVDVLAIPAPVVQALVLPCLTRADRDKLDQELDALEANTPQANTSSEQARLMEFLVEERAINGTAAMFIDLDRCTRCDDCVRACAATHDNNPRFIRQGPQEEGIQLTHACMHCVDPVCMIGCPTGAIRRGAVGDQVVIDEFTCIGCSTCADNCPYENIQMVEVRNAKGDFPTGTRIDPELGRVRSEPEVEPLRKATKCDLCETLLGGPACERACPHDALLRVDVQEPDPLFEWLNRR